MQNPQVDDGLSSSFGVTSRPREESISAANPSFTDGVATKDIYIDPLTSLALRIFLPDSCHDSAFKSRSIKSRAKDIRPFDYSDPRSDLNQLLLRRNSYGSANGVTTTTPTVTIRNQNHRRNSYGCSSDNVNLKSDSGVYGGYNPRNKNCQKLPVILQFHGRGFVSGSNASVVNDFFCRRIAKACDVIVLAVGYRLAPENRYPAAFEDGLKVLHWLAKQATTPLL
nr:probable carboxylesterase 16 [Coffea arabica]XP_027076797.1 probable carboxylesterase 16 [Coffea arabica]